MSITARLLLSGLLLLGTVTAARAQGALRVYAAASLTDALDELATSWVDRGHPRPVLVLAASSTLAKQIEHGAPADVFASADERWMDYLAARSRIQTHTRVDLLANRLVLIAPRTRPIALSSEPQADLGAHFDGPLCMGEPGVVPAGVYAQQALTAIGAWPALERRIVGTDDVRTALAFVETGACAAGIVYATDAVISSRVMIAARFPDASHDPIRYPFAAVTGAADGTADFLAFLASTAARAVFARHGFSAPQSP